MCVKSGEEHPPTGFHYRHYTERWEKVILICLFFFNAIKKRDEGTKMNRKPKCIRGKGEWSCGAPLKKFLHIWTCFLSIHSHQMRCSFRLYVSISTYQNGQKRIEKNFDLFLLSFWTSTKPNPTFSRPPHSNKWLPVNYCHLHWWRRKFLIPVS